ncbi:hypothetical protein YC2023_071514 [Brassica napus]
MATKPNGKSPVLSASDEKVMLFRDVSLGPHETQLRFRLIHFWEAWNPIKKTLIGLEMLLIDEQGTVIQGFISPGRIEQYLGKLKRGTLSVLEDITTPFDKDRFLFHSYEVFEANCDLKGDLYDVVGHMKLVNGHTLTERPVLDEVQIAAARHLLDTKSPTLYHTNTQCLKSQDGGKGFMHDQTGGEKVKYVRKLLQQAADLSLPKRKLLAADDNHVTELMSKHSKQLVTCMCCY